MGVGLGPLQRVLWARPWVASEMACGAQGLGGRDYCGWAGLCGWGVGAACGGQGCGGTVSCEWGLFVAARGTPGWGRGYGGVLP